MEGTPSFHPPGKKINAASFFRNCWCPNYDDCLSIAAVRDHYLDCAACHLKDSVVDEFSFYLQGSPRPSPA